MIRVFLGFDQVEAVSWSVFNYSIQRRASQPVQVTPIMLSQLKDIFEREWDAKQSNEFAFSRWLVPYLCDYEGWAIFADCDMLCREDIAELWKLRDERYAVQVVKHDYIPRSETKFLGQEQTKYKRKNWSSVMLMNCAKCEALTPEYVRTAHGLDLHQFKWLDSNQIGELPKEWNHLVGEYPPNLDAKIVHWTIEGPWFLEHIWKEVEFASDWYAEQRLMLHSDKPAAKEVPIEMAQAKGVPLAT